MNEGSTPDLLDSEGSGYVKEPPWDEPDDLCPHCGEVGYRDQPENCTFCADLREQHRGWRSRAENSQQEANDAGH